MFNDWIPAFAGMTPLQQPFRRKNKLKIVTPAEAGVQSAIK